MNVIEIKVEGMTCNGCKSTVREVLSRVPGARDVEVDLATGLVRVSGDPAREELVEAVEAAGFDVAPAP